MTTGSPSDRFQRTDGLDLSKITPSFCLIWDFQHYLSTMTFLTLHFKEHMNIDMGFHEKVNVEGAEDVEGKEAAASGVVRSRSLVRASWDVPHGGGRQRQPEFYKLLHKTGKKKKTHKNYRDRLLR
ncbi:hypothetical protein C4D60_Mb04t37090 [Musa balbisiana]|uniref:Uncharacterized protein n=1 Tax=Musa balbisiana TaxID=52838 RepID=A0A4S8KHC9_MUSBA|nr:hypothetical protein C4D60_Mb04t37090 [Musa balbisiana]